MKKTIETPAAPAAIGPYSKAIQVDNTVYLSGQIPLNPVTNELVQGSLAEQTAQIFENLRAVTKAAGGDLNSIVRVCIYLTDLNNFAIVNEVMATYFDAPYPARTTIGVSALPKGAVVEIDAIMVL